MSCLGGRAGCKSSKCYAKTSSPFCQLSPPLARGLVTGGVSQEGKSQAARLEQGPALRRSFPIALDSPTGDPGISMEEETLPRGFQISDTGSFDHQHGDHLITNISHLSKFCPLFCSSSPTQGTELHAIKHCQWKQVDSPVAALRTPVPGATHPAAQPLHCAHK